MSVDINTNTDLETLTNLLPSDVETLKGKGKIDTFNQLLSTDSFPLDNTTFLLFFGCGHMVRLREYNFNEI